MTTGKTESARKARCAGWRAISYAVKGDTNAGETHGDTSGTTNEVRAHNQTGRNKRCWK